MTLQAFPTMTYEYDGQSNVLQYQNDGMTLRDYFAAKTMQAMLSSPHCPRQVDEEKLAKQAYSLSDVMMKAREVKNA